MRRLLLVCAMLFVANIQQVVAQQGRELGVTFGMTMMEFYDEVYPWSHVVNDHPEWGLNNDDMKGYSIYGTPGPDEYPIIPTAFTVSYGNGFQSAESSFWKHCSSVYSLGIAYVYCHENNREKTVKLGNSIAGNPIVFRDFHEVYIDATMLHASYGLHYVGNFIGKQKRTRLSAGLSVLQGMSWMQVNYSQEDGIYEQVTETSGKVKYYYIYEPNQSPDMNSRDNRYLSGFTVPLNVEWALGSQKRTLIGFQYSFGNSWLYHSGKHTISTVYISGGASVRLLLN